MYRIHKVFTIDSSAFLGRINMVYFSFAGISFSLTVICFAGFSFSYPFFCPSFRGRDGGGRLIYHSSGSLYGGGL